MSDQSSQVSRRSVTSGGSTLLAGFGPGMALPVSGYADSGWRAAAGDPRRIAVDRAAVEARLGAATGPDDFARKAEFVDYESHRAMFEAGNSRLRDAPGGLTQWTSHPAWSSAAWGPHGHDGALDVGGAYYGARKGGEPLHIQADPVSGEVIAVNHTTHPVTLGTVTAHYYDLDGRQLVPEQRKRVNIAPSATAAVFTADKMADHPPLHLLRLRMEDPLGGLLSENTYWRYRDAADMRGLNTVRRTRVSAELGTPGEDGARRTLTASVRNQGSAVAAMVRLSLLDGQTGARVLPALSSDNYLWLLPGESRTVTLSWPSSALPAGHQPKLQVDGYNAPRAIAR